MRKVWTAPVGFGGNCRIVGVPGRNRAGEETRAEHRDDNETQKVGSLVAVVKRFLQYPRVIATLERVSSA